MTDYEVGYGKPPKNSQFKKGVCSNPRGRNKQPSTIYQQVIEKVLYRRAEFRENGCVKKASRLEIEIRRLGRCGNRGDVESAAKLLKMHSHAKTEGDTAPIVIVVTGGLPKPGEEMIWSPGVFDV